MALENWLADLLGYWEIVVNGGLALPRRKSLKVNGPYVSGSDDGTASVLTFADPGGGGGTTALKAAVRVATTANIALSGLITVDGIPLGLDDRVLVKNQAVPADNGIYLAKTTAWLRATDADASGDWPTGTIVPVDQGTTQADALFRLTTNAPIVLGTSALNFARFDTADAISLRGVAISAVAAAASEVYALSGGVWTAGLLANANLAAAAAIAISKLANGAEGQVITTISGVPTWAVPAASPESYISPPAITTAQNNYAPAGHSTATVERWTSTGDQTVNGLDSSALVKRKLIINANGGSTDDLTLAHLAGGQSAGNQFFSPTGAAFKLAPGNAVWVVQDATSGYWRIVIPPAGADYVYNGTFTGALSIDITGPVEAARFIIDHASNEWDYKTPRTRQVWIPACAFTPSDSARIPTSANSLQLEASTAGAFCDLQPYLPTGATVTGLFVRVNQNAGVSAQAMRATLMHTAIAIFPPFSGDVPTIVLDAELDTALSGDQLISALSATIHANNLPSAAIDKGGQMLTLTVLASDAATGGNPELLLGAILSFTDPGPRNF